MEAVASGNDDNVMHGSDAWRRARPPSAASTNPGVGLALPTQQHWCSLCKKDKPTEAFKIREFKRHGKDAWRCIACRDSVLRPPCCKCGERPGKALQHPLPLYMCPSCRYPLCDVCGVTPRPATGKYTVENRPTWTCPMCAPQGRHGCTVCKELKGRDDYPAEQWRHRARQAARCFQCYYPRCTPTACPTCPVCRDPRCQKDTCDDPVVPPTLQLPQSRRDVDTFLCVRCRYPCGLCEERKGEHEFPNAMWHNRHEQRLLCNRCCNPPCTSQNCSRCLVCRDETCRRRNCDSPVKSLNPKQFLKRKEDLDTYLCQRCRYITCQCGSQMSKSSQKRKRERLHQETYVCVDCQCRTQMQADAVMCRLGRSRENPSG